ncbi:hypothetical protein D3C71_1664560 [compost metagenome]
MGVRTFDKPDISLQCRDSVYHFLGVANAQMDLACAVQFCPLRHQTRQQVFADRKTGDYPQWDSVLIGKERLHISCLIDQRLGFWQQRAPILIKQQASADSVEQFHSECGLELRQRAARRRLRAGNSVGRRACTAAVCSCEENFKLTQVDVQTLERMLI